MRGVSFPTFLPTRCFLTVASLLAVVACADDGTKDLDDDTKVRHIVDVTLENVNHKECTASGCVQKSIQLMIESAGEDPPCCTVAPGANRKRTLDTFDGDTVFLKACRVDGAMGCDTNRCRVVDSAPDPLLGRAQMIARFDNEALTGTIGCSGDWETF